MTLHRCMLGFLCLRSKKASVEGFVKPGGSPVSGPSLGAFSSNSFPGFTACLCGVVLEDVCPLSAPVLDCHLSATLTWFHGVHQNSAVQSAGTPCPGSVPRGAQTHGLPARSQECWQVLFSSLSAPRDSRRAGKCLLPTPGDVCGPLAHTTLRVTRVALASDRTHPFPRLITECCRPSLGSCLPDRARGEAVGRM